MCRHRFSKRFGWNDKTNNAKSNICSQLEVVLETLPFLPENTTIGRYATDLVLVVREPTV